LNARTTSPEARRPTPRAQRSKTVRRRRQRAGLLLALGILAFAAGGVLGARHKSAGERQAERFARAWERGDYTTMYTQLADGTRSHVTLVRFTNAYEAAMRTATAERVIAGSPRKHGDGYRVDVTIPTRIFGTVTGQVVLPAAGSGLGWSRALVFPGLAKGERLHRVTRMPRRATLLARDKTVLAKGDDRSSSSPLAPQVVGQLGPIPPERRNELTALGVPRNAKVGVSGLERVFDDRLIGRPGGELMAGGRVLAHTVPRQAAALRTTISLPVEQAAVTSLGTRLGGAVAIAPHTGEVLAFAGIAFSGLQPPGSTFKMVTATGALEAGITSPSRSYPIQTNAVIEGVELDNANREACGGTLVESFARSCNSVFAPLGVQLGAKRLVSAAERYGFNAPPDIAGAAESTIPPADEIGDDLALGSSAIGQGRVQATALEMASIAATIGMRGRRPRLTLDYDAAHGRRAPTRRVTSQRIAKTMERLMLAVVRGGTGVNAAIPGVAVAGKTGTAELKTTVRCNPQQPGTQTETQTQAPATAQGCTPEQQQQPNDPTDTDAWFAAYAPAGKGRPHVAVGILLVASGAGADTAAPAARQVLVAGLKATR
jgi:peptidoglycan glycosyltransferase